MFGMKSKSEKRIEQGCCYPESKTESAGCTKIARSLDQNSSTSSLAHASVYTLGNNGRKAFEAYKLQVEERRSSAIETARRSTFL